MRFIFRLVRRWAAWFLAIVDEAYAAYLGEAFKGGETPSKPPPAREVHAPLRQPVLPSPDLSRVGVQVPVAMAHHCHAYGCKTTVDPTLLMCLNHWRKVPLSLQRAVWATYLRGQCNDMQPSAAYLKAATEAVVWVARFEGRWPKEVQPPQTPTLREYLLVCSRGPLWSQAPSRTILPAK